jgi:hypothetical protein
MCVLTATVTSKYNRFDDFEGDADEDDPDLNEDEEDLDEVESNEGNEEFEAVEAEDNESVSPPLRSTSVEPLMEAHHVEDKENPPTELVNSVYSVVRQGPSSEHLNLTRSKSFTDAVTPSTDVIERKESVSKSMIGSKAQEVRANALTEKLRRKLNISDSETLIAGKSPHVHPQDYFRNFLLIFVVFRIFLLAAEEYSTSGSFVLDYQACLLLCLPTSEEIDSHNVWNIKQEA